MEGPVLLGRMGTCIGIVAVFDTVTLDRRRTKPQWSEVQHNEQYGSKVKVCRTAWDKVNFIQLSVCCFMIETIKELGIRCKISHTANTCNHCHMASPCYCNIICTICCIIVTVRYEHYTAFVAVSFIVLNGLEYLVIEPKRFVKPIVPSRQWKLL